jgi:2-polyprenyl-3-methyl-5-hydroxy-6-metoxy-1,4-benzoquinol methylase
MTDLPVRQYFLNSRQEVAPFLPTHYLRTLEIGCGAGGFSQTYLKLAQEKWGIEPDIEAAAIATPKFHNLLVGTYDQACTKLPDNYFDLVVCNDVIEHMRDHDAFLRGIKSKMKSGAYLVGSIPNIRHFTALIKLLIFKDWPYANDGILDRTHLRFFTKKSLRRAFIENGYEIEELQGIRSIVRDGVTGLSPMQNVATRLAAAVLVGASFGYWSDTQYPQFAFRIRYQNQLP